MNTVQHTTMTLLIAATALATVIASPANARVHSRVSAHALAVFGESLIFVFG